MDTLIRLLVWLLERSVELILLSVLLNVISPAPGLDPGIWGLAFIIGLILCWHGYYLTTAFFGVVWRSATWWVYPGIIAALFVIHTHIIFVSLKHDFTPQGKAMELPIALLGACIVFACAFGGSRILEWLGTGDSTNAYLSAAVVTLWALILANAFGWLHREIVDRPLYGLPFHFYSGSYAVGGVWRRGELLWRGVIADGALVAGTIVVIGKVWQRLDAHRAQ